MLGNPGAGSPGRAMGTKLDLSLLASCSLVLPCSTPSTCCRGSDPCDVAV